LPTALAVGTVGTFKPAVPELFLAELLHATRVRPAATTAMYVRHPRSDVLMAFPFIGDE
jgi:hypothetical protein